MDYVKEEKKKDEIRKINKFMIRYFYILKKIIICFYFLKKILFLPLKINLFFWSCISNLERSWVKYCLFYVKYKQCCLKDLTL